MLNAFRSVLALALMLTLCARPAAAQDQDTVDLRPHWTAGQSAAYDFWSRSEKTITAEAFGQSQTQTVVYLTEGRTAWTVNQVAEDGSSVCTMHIQTLRITITPDEGEPVEVDSENPSGEDPDFDRFLAAVVGTPLTVHVNADGTIEKVEGVDEMTRQAGEEAADSMPDELDFKQNASELATLIAAPAGAKVGDTWRARNTWNQDTMLSQVLPGVEATTDWDTTFTLGSVGPIEGVSIASVSARSTLDIKIDKSGLPEEAQQIGIEVVDAAASGEVLYDLSRHETAGRNDAVRFTIQLTIPAPRPDMPPMTMRIAENSQSQLLRVEEDAE